MKARSPSLADGSTADWALMQVQVALIREQQAADELRSWVAIARERGVSWTALGTILGTSRQAVTQRFGSTP